MNDTVRIFFTGDFEIKSVRAGKMLLVPEKGDDGHVYYDVTAALRTGKTYITAEFSGGRAEGFFFDVKRIITVCSAACRFHSMVVQNLFFAISEKNRKLVQKLGHMCERTTREKLISYLSEEAEKQNSYCCALY